MEGDKNQVLLLGAEQDLEKSDGKRERPLSLSSMSSSIAGSPHHKKTRLNEFDTDSLTKMSSDQKLDLIILELVKLNKHSIGTDHFVEELSSKIDSNKKEVDEVKQDLEAKVRYLEGRNIRLENKLDKIVDRLETQEYRSMRENIIIYNLNEETEEDCEKVAKKFFIEKMKCTNEAKILIDIAHRPRQQSRRNVKPRPLIVAMLSKASKNYVMRHVKNLSETDYSVSDQLPQAMKERRLSQVKTYKKARQNPKHKNVKLVRDCLYIDGKLQDGKFESNPIFPSAPTSQIEFTESEGIYEKDSILGGYAKQINSTKDAEEGLGKLLENIENANAKHIWYMHIV